MIYALEAVGTEFIKIGISNNVGRRITEIQNGLPMDVNILAIVDWPHAEERRIHVYLDGSWQRGEWFRRSSDVEHIISLMRDPDGLAKWIAIRLNAFPMMKDKPKPVGDKPWYMSTNRSLPTQAPRVANEPDFTTSSLAAKLAVR